MFPTAFIILVGFVGSVLTIYEFINSRIGHFPKRSQILAFVFLTVTLILIVGSIFFASIISPTSDNRSESNNILAVKSPQTGTGVTPVQASPTPTPSPSPTSPPHSGTLLYQANWSGGMNGWGGTTDWQPSNDMLVNNGSQSTSISIAPYIPSDYNISDYAVEADIQFIRFSDVGAFGGLDSFGILVRSPDGQTGYTFAICASAGIDNCGSNSHEILISNGKQNIAEYTYQPNNNDWHTYRIEVKGDTIKVSIDGRSFLNGTDTTYLTGGQIGLMSNRSQISVRSFKVIAL